MGGVHLARSKVPSEFDWHAFVGPHLFFAG